MKYVLAAIAFIAVAVWGVWLIGVPAEFIEQRAESEMRAQGIDADLAGFEKGWFYNIRSEALHLRNQNVTLISVYKLKGKIEFGKLLRLRLSMALDGFLGGGKLEGKIERGIFKDTAPSVDLVLKNAKLEEMNLYALTGQQADGTLEARAELESGSGEMIFDVPDIKAREISLRGMQLPYELSGRLMGKVEIKGRTLELHSVSFEGGGLYARATGTVSAAGNNIKLELMPEGDKFNDPALAAFMSGFKVAKGRYVVSIGR
jgi:type II secretion system protein N